jgi:hypothetical protein
MAPKCVKTFQELEVDQIRWTMAFYPPRSSRTRANELMGWVTDETNEHGAMALLDAKVGVLLNSLLSWRSMGCCCRGSTQTPSWSWRSSSSSARPSWGFIRWSRSSTITTT